MFFVWKEFIQNMLWVVLNFDEKSLVCSVTKGLKVFTICRVITKLFRFVKECVNSSMFLNHTIAIPHHEEEAYVILDTTFAWKTLCKPS